MSSPSEMKEVPAFDENDDAHLWSTEDVIQQFCFEQNPVWCTPLQPIAIPDRLALKLVFKENHINGECLLELDLPTLRDDLRVRSFGQRRAICSAIAILRSRSKRYQQKIAASAIKAEPIQSSLSKHLDASRSAILNQLESDQNQTKDSSKYARSCFGSGHNLIHHSTPTNIAINSNRCTLGSSRSAVADPPELFNFDKLQIANSSSPAASSTYLYDDRIERNNLQERNSRIGSKITAIPKTKPGEPEQKGTRSSENPATALPDETSDTNVFSKSPFAQGKEELQVPKPKKRIAPVNVIDYRSTTFRPNSSNLQLVPFQNNLNSLLTESIDSEVSQDDALQSSTELEDLSDQRELPVSSQAKESLIRDYDYLLDKYPTYDDDDEVFPIYGESGDENEYDEKTWNEYLLECCERQSQNITVSRDKVRQAVEECLDELRKLWRETKLDKAKFKAYKIWEKATKIGSRSFEIKHLQRKKERAMTNINRVRQTLIDDVSCKVSDAKTLTMNNMEAYLFDYEEFDFCLQVLENDRPPELPSREVLKRKPEQLVEIPGEENLDSETESSEDDFVVDDEPRATSIYRNTIADNVNGATQNKISSNLGETSLSPEPLLGQYDMDNNADDELLTNDEDEVLSSRDKRRFRRNVCSLPQLRRSSMSDESEVESIAFRSKSPFTKAQKSGKNSYDLIDLTMSSPVHADTRSLEAMTPTFDATTEGTLSDIEQFADNFKAQCGESKLLNKPETRINPFSSIDTTSTPSTPSDQIVVSSPSSSQTNDEIIKLMLAKQAASDPHLRELMETVQNSQASLEQLREFSSYVDQIEAALKSKETLLIQTSTASINSKLPPKAQEHKASVVLKLKLNQDRPSIKRKGQDRSNDDESESDESNISFDKPQPNITKKIRKKGKRRRIEINPTTETGLKNAQARVIEEAARRALMERRLERMEIVGNTTVAVNSTEPFVYLDDKIACRVKKHQIEGIQFMWRELITDPKCQGCLLAHTMGLGKTMQVISLLVTLAQTNDSTDPAVRNHIPLHLRENKTLILCPSSLTENWYDEIMLWIPETTTLGAIHKIIEKRDYPLISEWSKTGGLLIISYERFKRLAAEKLDADKKASTADIISQKACETRDSEEEKANDIEVAYGDMLLNESRIIIADEAHSMKNSSSMLTKVAQKFKSTSRIALTGSPLNNHLEEYHTMINWIAPGYLGSREEFRDKYSIPIQEGLYKESTNIQRRLAMRKLHILKCDLDPKIHRAGIEAIAADMPFKAEFFITISLTEQQKVAYNTFVKSLLANHHVYDKSGSAYLWNWLAILSLLCNHPFCFVNKLLSRVAHLNTSKGGPDNDSEDATPKSGITPESMPVDVSIDKDQHLLEAMEKAAEVFQTQKDFGTLGDASLSYRTLIVQHIVQEARSVDDKTLIFTHSIPTLDYLQTLMEKLGCNYLRLDGNTKLRDRQAATKKFNREGSSLDVFLISMRAGGLGLNLQGANRVIIFDFSFNPSWEEQSVARAFRLGQKKPVFVYRFRTAGTFEENIYNKATFKTQLFQRVVDRKNPMRHASKSVNDYLFEVKDIEKKDFSESLGKDPKVLDPLLKKVNFVLNVELTETFQKEEDETLTEEDLRQLNEEVEDTKLQRTNPEAWLRKKAQKQMALQHAHRQNRVQSAYTSSQPGLGSTPNMKTGLSATKLPESLTRTQPNHALVTGVQKYDPIQGWLSNHFTSSPSINARSTSSIASTSMMYSPIPGYTYDDGTYDRIQHAEENRPRSVPPDAINTHVGRGSQPEQALHRGVLQDLVGTLLPTVPNIIAQSTRNQK